MPLIFIFIFIFIFTFIFILASHAILTLTREGNAPYLLKYIPILDHILLSVRHQKKIYILVLTWPCYGIILCYGVNPYG